jgi:YD repeat-containing protein
MEITMKKIMMIITIILFINVSLFTQTSNNNFKVKEKITKNSNGLNTSIISFYDDYGNLVKLIGKNKDGKEDIILTNDYTYDKDGNIIKVILEDFEGFISVVKYQYDKYGNKIKETIKENNHNFTIKEYDSKGNIIKIIIDGSHYQDYPYIENYEYDKNGNLLKKTTSNETYEIYEYDKNGNIIKQETKKIDGSISIIVYDKNGNILEEKTQDKYNVYDTITTYIYDNDGYLIEKRFRNWNNKVSSDTYEYDENGNLLKKTISNETFEYDKNGNMIKKIVKCYETINVYNYTYDFENMRVKRESYTEDLDGNIENKKIYSYELKIKVVKLIKEEFNTHKDIIKRIEKLNIGTDKITEWVYKYDENGNKIFEKMIEDRYIYQKIYYDYTSNYNIETNDFYMIMKNFYSYFPEMNQIMLLRKEDIIRPIGIVKIDNNITKSIEWIYNYDNFGNLIYEKKIENEGNEEKFWEETTYILEKQ